MYFIDSDNRVSKELIPGVNARTFWGDNMLLALVDLDAEAIIPSHSHVHEQCGIVLDGELHFCIGGETKVLLPGQMYMIPSGIEHSVVVGSAPARLLDVFSPVREEYKY